MFLLWKIKNCVIDTFTYYLFSKLSLLNYYFQHPTSRVSGSSSKIGPSMLPLRIASSLCFIYFASMLLLINEALVLGLMIPFPLGVTFSMTTSNYSSLEDCKRFMATLCVLLNPESPPRKYSSLPPFWISIVLPSWDPARED